MNFPGDGGALLLDRGLQVLRQLCQTPFRGCQLGGCQLARAPGLVHFQGPLQHVGQPRHIVLEQVVGNPQADGVDSRRLANGPGQQDKRRAG